MKALKATTTSEPLSMVAGRKLALYLISCQLLLVTCGVVVCAAHNVHVAAKTKQIPAEYQEKSKLLLKSYQLRKLAWNDTAQKNYQAAADNLHQAITIAGRCYGKNSKLLLPLYMDLASVEQQANQSSKAAAALSTCLKLDPTFADASIKLALAKLRQGDINQALMVGKQAQKLAPQDPRTHVLMSVLLSKAGEADRAAQEKKVSRKLFQAMPQIKSPPANFLPKQQATPTAEQETQPELQSLPEHENDESDSELELP